MVITRNYDLHLDSYLDLFKSFIHNDIYARKTELYYVTIFAYLNMGLFILLKIQMLVIAHKN